jgi:PhoH-like ATPase
MKKRFVLDTNVLLQDPMAIQHFADNEVIVPIYAIEEIDHFKRELSERGRSARLVTRFLDDMRGQGGRLSEGVPTNGGGQLRVALPDRNHDPGGRRAEVTADDLILAVALEEKRRDPDGPVIFVTRDVNLRIRADAMGLEVVNYIEERVDITELYTGTGELEVPPDRVDRFYAEGRLSLDDEAVAGLAGHPNQFFVIKDDQNPSHSGIGRLDEGQRALVPILKVRDGIWGIRPRNKEQHFAFDLLMNDEVKLVTLVGKAGTGKTLLAIAAGLQKVIEAHTFKKLLVSRPIFPLGRDVGFLPGDLEEKLNPWMQPIYDNLDLLMSGIKPERKDRDDRPDRAERSDRPNERSYQDLFDMGFVAVEPLTYIRGRSIPNRFMIVDEAQNLTPHEVKTIITRVGDNTKIILTGDPYQIDNPYVDSANNGLTTVVERFKGTRIAGHITLLKGERSELAELAANILE